MDEFGRHTENDTLRDLIAVEIAERGSITFHRFMELALYHSRHGYYAATEEAIGRRGDYLTSPEISPLFGAMIGRQAAEVWERLGHPREFTIIEAGPGAGTMAMDVLRWAARAAPELRCALRYVLVERAAAQRARQRRLLDGEEGVSWSETLPADVSGIIFSNELLDAFPVHLVRVADGRLQEGFVVARGGRFEEAWRPPSTADLPAYFQALGRLPGDGARAEVNLDAPRWMGAAARSLARGLVLTLDYGYPAAKLYAPWRKQGTLLCFSRHTAGDDPFVRIGRQDMTAHVDFTTVARAGIDAGLALAGFASQREFLTALGIHEALAGPKNEEYVARYRAITELLEPAGLGRVRALAMTRDIDGAPLRGFAGSDDVMQTLFSE